MPPPAPSATILLSLALSPPVSLPSVHSTPSPELLKLPHALCVREQHLWQGDSVEAAPSWAEHPPASVTPAPHIQQHMGHPMTARQDHASATLPLFPPPSLALPLLATKHVSLCDTGTPYALLKTLFLKGCERIILQPQWHAWILKMSTLALRNVLSQVRAGNTAKPPHGLKEQPHKWGSIPYLSLFSSINKINQQF